MAVYLKTQWELVNLNLVKSISLGKEGIMLDDIKVHCGRDEVAQLLHDDICEAINQFGINGNATRIEAFTKCEWSGKDKYSLKVQEIAEREREEEREEERGRRASQVLDALKKQAFRLFHVKCTFLCLCKPDFFNSYLDEHIYALDEKILTAWLKEHEYGKNNEDAFRKIKPNSIQIKERKTLGVFACHSSLLCDRKFKILDAQDYEKKGKKDA